MTGPRWILFLVFSLGSGLRVFALSKIRPYYWPSIALFADQRIVKEGPYRLFAHPLYLGLAIESIALAGLSGRMPAAVVAFMLVFAMQVQVQREEAVLDERFGLLYRKYREETFDLGDVFPRPWRRDTERPGTPSDDQRPHAKATRNGFHNTWV
ncbi:MAG: isoprenylcysteine carboxylmethyltransferase family protein [Thermoanaerobaculia bacterium]